MPIVTGERRRHNSRKLARNRLTFLCLIPKPTEVRGRAQHTDTSDTFASLEAKNFSAAHWLLTANVRLSLNKSGPG